MGPNPEDYTVAWICGLFSEYFAASLVLDKEYKAQGYMWFRHAYRYALGTIGKHNIVIASLSEGKYGNVSVASMITDLLNSFPNIRIALLVGIGGGVPSEQHDIRLGDVVVGIPCEHHFGVLEYDFRKTMLNESFRKTRLLSGPPAVLRTAAVEVQTRYNIEEAMANIPFRHHWQRGKCNRPNIDTDRLFKSHVTHYYDGCAEVCAGDESNLVNRRKRTENEKNPAIHYGLIASGNHLIKDAEVRDELAAEKCVLCFETEATGLADGFPCLVIRGICDYSDSHRNREWHQYAALAAAIFAKDLLNLLSPEQVNEEKTIRECLSMPSKSTYKVERSVRGMKSQSDQGENDKFLFAQPYIDSITDEVSRKELMEVLSDSHRKQLSSAQLEVLTKAYNSAMDGVRGQRDDFRLLAERVLSWIIYAKRQLTIEELQHALAIDVEKSTLDQNNIPEHELVVSVCCGLVISDNYRGTIQLVHYTAEEYFDRTRHHWFTEREVYITKACIAYLSLEIFQDSPPPIGSYPFYTYAASHWGYHAEHVSNKREYVASMEELVITFLKNPLRVRNLVNHVIHTGMEGLENTAGIHLAVFFGLANIIPALVKHGHDPNIQDNGGRTPLSFAAERGRESVVIALLHSGANPNTKATNYEYINEKSDQIACNAGRTPLSFAAEKGHLTAITALLAHKDILLNAADECHRTPFYWAVKQGHQSVAEILERHGGNLAPIEDVQNIDPIQFPLPIIKDRLSFQNPEIIWFSGGDEMIEVDCKMINNSILIKNLVKFFDVKLIRPIVIPNAHKAALGKVIEWHKYDDEDVNIEYEGRFDLSVNGGHSTTYGHILGSTYKKKKVLHISDRYRFLFSIER